MEAVLKKLVAKTAGWSVDKLRDELLQLNKLAYPFRNRFDRADLMMVRLWSVECHVCEECPCTDRVELACAGYRGASDDDAVMDSYNGKYTHRLHPLVCH